MTYPLWTTSRPGYSPQATQPYVVPLRNGIFNGSLKKPISAATHGAVCTQDIRYELRIRDEQKEPNAAEYLYKYTYEKEWRDRRHAKDDQWPEHLGYLTRPYGPNQIRDVAFEMLDKTFKQKYPFDFKNSGFRPPTRQSDRRHNLQEETPAVSRQLRRRGSSGGGGFGDQRGRYGVDCCCWVYHGRWDGVRFNDGCCRCKSR